MFHSFGWLPTGAGFRNHRSTGRDQAGSATAPVVVVLTYGPGVQTWLGNSLVIGIYHLVMTNIAMENPNHKWRFIAGKIIYFYGPSIPWLC